LFSLRPGIRAATLGTAFYIYNTVLGLPRKFEMHHALWALNFLTPKLGPCSTRRRRYTKQRKTRRNCSNPPRALIADGKVVAWFQGRLEFGPRALGARSLLADARDNNMKDTINAKVKFREAFRPFAPAVLREHAHEYFKMPKDIDMPFMLLVPKVAAREAGGDSAVTHEDGTGRVQTVTEEHNGRYYRLIRAFHRLTGVPVVINTSFNVRGEPIVCTPQDAYHTFVNTGIERAGDRRLIVTHKPSLVDYDAGMKRSVALEAGCERLSA
jgi:carbamoyltransferase